MYEISVVKTQVEKFCETHSNKCVKTKFDSGCGTCEFDIGDCILVVVYNEQYMDALHNTQGNWTIQG